MADNITLNAGTGGAVVATDDDGAAHHQYVKVEFGPDNTQTKVTSSVGLPVDVVAGGITAYTEDVATANPIVGQAVMMERDDALSAVTPLEGDWVGLRGSAEGALWVQDFNSDAIVTDTGTIAGDTTSIDGKITACDTGAVVIASGTTAVTNAGTFAVQVSDPSFAVADGNALGEGVLVQGDDGTDRKNIHVDATTGDVQVDVTNTVTVDGSAVTQPVSGTVTANLSATDNAVLDSIDTAVNGTLTVGSHAVTNAGTFATQEDGPLLTAAQLLDDTIFADDAAFTLASSKVSMAGAIRDDALTTLTAIDGDAVPLRVSSTGALHVTGGGGGTEYNVDDPGPTVVSMAGAVRDDTLTTLTEADGDATLLRVSSTGALHVTGGGGGTEYTEDVATANPIVGTATLMERDDALTTVTPLEGDWIGLRGSAEGALWTQDFNSDAILADTTAILADTANMDTNLGTVAGAVAAGQMQVDIVADGAGLLTTSAHDAAFGTAGTADAQVRSIQGIAGMTAVVVDGSAVTQPVSGTVTANPASGTIDTVTTVATVTNLSQLGGAAVSMNTGVRDAGTQRVTIATNDTVTVTATNLDVQSGGVDLATSSQGAAIQTAVELIDNAAVAHDAAASSAGVNMIGLEGRNTEPTAVGTTGDATRALGTTLGKQVTVPYAIPASTWHYASAAAVTDTADDAAKAAAGAGIRNYVTGIQVFNGHDTVGTEVVIKDGSTVMWRGWAEQIGGGCSARFDPPLRATANTAVNVANMTTGSSTYFNLQGYEAAE